jgi:uncharacterized tellurite resistance protein B-like protein
MHNLLGGTLRAGDPRRFLVEIMVGAIHADGRVDERERTALREILAEHDLFVALPAAAAEALIESATDALLFAGGLEVRLERIAAALPWRLHRIAAYAMATELIAADGVIAEDEDRYLRSLRRALVIGHQEADALLEAAQRRRAMSTLEVTSSRVASLLPEVARACAVGVGLDATRIQSALSQLLDFRDAPPLAPAAIEAMHRELPADAADACIEMARRIPDSADRYWVMTYRLALEAGAGSAGWRQRELPRLLRLAFEMSERALDRAEAHAGRMLEITANRR